MITHVFPASQVFKSGMAIIVSDKYLISVTIPLGQHKDKYSNRSQILWKHENIPTLLQVYSYHHAPMVSSATLDTEQYRLMRSKVTGAIIEVCRDEGVTHYCSASDK